VIIVYFYICCFFQQLSFLPESPNCSCEVITDFHPGLPDATFSDQKSQFGQIFEGLALEEVGIFYGHLVYSVAI
jgi:hypothetical protein